jgi:23S rRNA (cytosine1962-C5)-methyltransferase
MLELGHPWVIADRFTRQWPMLPPGSLATLCDAQGRELATALIDSPERVVARVLGRRPLLLNQGWFAQRIDDAMRLRTDHADLVDTTAYRLVNGEGDALPGLTIDRYGEYLLVQLFSESWRPHLPSLAAALQETLRPTGIYEKFRPQQTRQLAGKSKKMSRLMAGRPVSGRMVVRENGLKLLVDLEEGLNSGLFLDQRRNRRDLMQRVSQRRVLNLFCYTGAFSVAAAVAGAAKVTSVDVSSTYLEWARENLRCNGIDLSRHPLICGDCFDQLQRFKRDGQQFDLILMDPPSFSTTTSSRFTTRQGTAELVAAALPLLPNGGLLIASSNHQKVDLADYLKELRRGALQAGCDLKVVQTLGQPEDFPYPVTFPEGRYLKYVLAVKGELAR